MSDTDKAPPPEDGNTFANETKDFLKFLVKLVVIIAILRSFLIAPFNIPSESMLPKLLTGDYLLVSKWNYGYSRNSLPYRMPLIPGQIFATMPERGDVVVFKAPPTDDIDFIKRVIGVAGDRLQMRDGQVILNGTAIEKKRIADFIIPVSPNTDCYASQFEETTTDGVRQCRYPRFKETLPGGKSYDVLDLMTIPKDNTEEFVVPQGRVFMMGDNRDNSKDSRFSADLEDGIGLVPQENLVGKAIVIVFSTDGSSTWYLPWTWFTAARWPRSGSGF